jgi:hypothetical protein
VIVAPALAVKTVRSIKDRSSRIAFEWKQPHGRDCFGCESYLPTMALLHLFDEVFGDGRNVVLSFSEWGFPDERNSSDKADRRGKVSLLLALEDYDWWPR